jgi:hypothetical protein
MMHRDTGLRFNCADIASSPAACLGTIPRVEWRRAMRAFFARTFIIVMLAIAALAAMAASAVASHGGCSDCGRIGYPVR